jgi:citrate lyase subunit beta/citryl-CoA lyase
MTTRLRSWMFVPGNRRRFIDKALEETRPDAVYLDLEDGVPPQEKALAREQIAEALARPATGVVRYVRVNRAGTDWWREDVEAVLVPGLDGICLPKVEDEEEVHLMRAELERFELDSGVAAGHVRILLAVESALGLLRAPALAACHERVSGLMFGAEDFALDLGLGTRREAEAAELVHARSSLVVAAASAHVMSVDGVFPDLEDEDGLWADVRQARRLGFHGKSTFHPKQMQVINEVFTPSADELEYARRVVTAFEEAQARGDGAVAVGGQLVDLPIVVRAQQLLDAVAEVRR